MKNKLVNILWTGGLDSSFRVIELSQMEVTIQPYYIVDPVRKSLKYELRAIKRITDIIRKHSRTKAVLLDLIKITTADILPNVSIANAFNELHSKYVIGHQYELIARYAIQNNLRFEMSLEKSDRSKAVNCILSETELVNFQDGEYKVLRLNSGKSSRESILIFSNIDFPLSLWQITKKEEIDRLVELGHRDTIKYTWFCHFPVFGMPCGHCNPCRDSIKEGLAFRVPIKGRLLYYIYKPFYFIKCRLHL